MDFKKELEKIGCIYTGHFVGVSGKHLAGYCNIDPLLPHVQLVNSFIKELVKPFKDDQAETVASPAIGAIPFSHWGAYHLSGMNGREIYGVWGDKVKTGDGTKAFAFEREGFLQAVKGKRILILEDMINQMFSIKGMIDTVTKAGGIIVGVGAVAANKGVSAEAMGVPKFIKLTSVEYDAWTPEDCAKSGLCSQNVPIVIDIGHGDEFQKQNPDYKGGYTSLLKS
jgi:orotate phosphoribosyltransferase